MTPTKLDKLKALIAKTNEKTGSNTLILGSDLTENKILETPFSTVNTLLKGIPRGRFTVIAGPEHTGKGAFCVQLAAHNQLKDPNFVVMWSDLENSFDPAWAESLGLDLSRVVFHGYTKEANTMEKMLDVALNLLQSQTIDMWVIDSIGALLPKADVETSKGEARSLEENNMLNLQRKLGEFFRKANVMINKDTKTGYDGCATVMIGQVYNVPTTTGVALEEVRGGNSVKHWAHLRLKFRRGPKSDWPDEQEVVGIDGVKRKKRPGWAGYIKVDKTRLNAAESQEVILKFFYGRGFNAALSTISAAFGLGIITRKGAYYECPVLKDKVQGKEEMIKILQAEPKLLSELATLVDKAYLEKNELPPEEIVEQEKTI